MFESEVSFSYALHSYPNTQLSGSYWSMYRRLRVTVEGYRIFVGELMSGDISTVL